jgi:predicted alpha-1,6-mannanase (GH76 family)
VRIVGESYCVLEPFITFDIVRRLGELGVWAEPFLTAHRWLGFHGLRLNKSEIIRARRAARRWWRQCVGGEDENSVGQFALAAEDGYAGVVHVGPFGCMPGTVSQPTLQRLSEVLDLPYMALSMDEHSSEAGLLTRLEAFVSLLERRRSRLD